MSDAQILQILGLAYLSAGLGVLINREFYKKLFKDFLELTPIFYLNGYIVLGVGFLLVTFHNTWTIDWSIIITIVGWIALIEGVMALALPRLTLAITRYLWQSKYFIFEAFLVMLLGMAWLYLGCFVL